MIVEKFLGVRSKGYVKAVNEAMWQCMTLLVNKMTYSKQTDLLCEIIFHLQNRFRFYWNQFGTLIIRIYESQNL